MKLNINFLQTGGVPLTADLMDRIEEQIKFYDFLGDLAGNFTILAGCVVNGSSVSSGVVAINGECYYFEGGLATSTVYINTQQIYRTFQDQTDKILIEKKSVKFGTSTPQNMFNWADFFRLDSLKSMQEKLAQKADLSTVISLLERVMKLEIKTAPIQNDSIVLPWFRPKDEIPYGWKECLYTRGKTIVHIDPNDVDLSVLKNTLGAKTHTLTINEMPKHSHQWRGLQGRSISAAQGSLRNSIEDATHTTGETGGNAPHNNMQPSILAYYIEPDFQ